MKDFGQNLLAECHKRGISPTALGRAVDISPSAMSNYKNGRIPKAEELLRIAEYLGVSMESLLTGSGESATAPLPGLPQVRDAASIEMDRNALDRIIRRMEGSLEMLRKFRDSFSNFPSLVSDPVVPFSATPKTEIPFYGAVAAGQPALVDYYSDETRMVPGKLGSGRHYLLRVRGQSMEPDYLDGSYVLVRALEPGEYPRKGDVVIADDGHGPTMKRLEYRKAGTPSDTPRKPTPHLVSINPDFDEVIPVTDTPIQGVVVDQFEEDFFG